MLKDVTQGLKSEFCKNLREKLGFDAKVTVTFASVAKW